MARRGWRSAERTYQHLTRELERKAHESRYAVALRLCLRELEQVHAHHYPTCAGGCPAEEAITAARKALR